MKRNVFIIAVLLCFTVLAYCQKTKSVTTKSESRGIKVKEITEVLKSDNTVKNGIYELWNNSKLICEGKYKNGKKDNQWISYSRNNIIVARRWYSEGTRSGQWGFFDREGNPDWTYDFDQKTATYFQHHEDDKNEYMYQESNGEWKKGKLDVNPLALIGKNEWLVYLNSNLRYPIEAQDKGEQGTVLVTIIVDENGESQDYSIYKSASPSLDEEALYMVKNFKYEFIPAEKDGKKVKVQYRIPISFHLEYN